MALQLIRAEEVVPQTWRNGGGRTRELLTWPSSDDWALRISVADIDVDGPFSAFDGVTRWMAVLAGSGVELAFADGERHLVPGDEPICFDGAAAPGCRLPDGPTRDLNLMLRGGRGTMQRVYPGVAWNEDFAMRGVFTAAAGHWAAGGESRTVPAMTLLWNHTARDGSDWTFEHDEPQSLTRAWWLGFTA